MTPDIIGTIYEPTGNTLTDSEGYEYPEMQAIEGFHVNFLKEVSEISQYKLDPQPVTPVRIYAGGISPICYVFPDEQTFRDYFPEPSESE